MLYAITFCFSDQNSNKFKRGIIQKTKCGLERKVDPDFEKGTYSVCHQKLREKMEVGGTLFFRTTWHDEPYIIGYFDIGEKVKGEYGPILIAKKKVCVDYDLSISIMTLEKIAPGFPHFSYILHKTMPQIVNYALGRQYKVLNEEQAIYLKTLIERIAKEKKRQK